MQHPNLADLRFQPLDQTLRQHRHPVLVALSFAHHDLAASEIHILDAQAQSFEQAHSGSVKQRHDQVHQGIVDRHDQALHLGARQHRRQTRRPLRPRHLVQPGQRLFEHLAIQEQDRRQRLPLRCRTHVPLDRQRRQKRLHLTLAHV
jgi:chemotaxis response regulator CheB